MLGSARSERGWCEDNVEVERGVSGQGKDRIGEQSGLGGGGISNGRKLFGCAPTT